MTRISQLDLAQINRQFDRLDTLEKVIREHAQLQDNLQVQLANLDFEHGKPTTNNLTFTWTGSTLTLSWATGFIQDKNAIAQKSSSVAAGATPPISSAPGVVHNYPVLGGHITNLGASTYYWIAWNPIQRQMVVSQDAGALYQNKSLIVICQIFTGTAGQTGTAGGGGANGVSDLSGLSYKLF